jgi:hypothetical protein
MSGNKNNRMTTTATQRKDSCVASTTKILQCGVLITAQATRVAVVALFFFVPPCYEVMLSPLFWPQILA